MRTPGCGAALPAWTAVEAPSKLSHADLPVPATDGDTEARFERGCACIVCADGGETRACPGGGVPFAIEPCGPVGACVPCGIGIGAPALPSTTVASPRVAWTPTSVCRGAWGPGGTRPAGIGADDGSTIVASCGGVIAPLPAAGGLALSERARAASASFSG